MHARRSGEGADAAVRLWEMAQSPRPCSLAGFDVQGDVPVSSLSSEKTHVIDSVRLIVLTGCSRRAAAGPGKAVAGPGLGSTTSAMEAKTRALPQQVRPVAPSNFTKA